MRILLVGLGNIATRHIKNIKAIDPRHKILVWRQKSKEEDLKKLKELVDGVVFDAERAIAWNCDAALLCNPAPFHIQTALQLAKQGTDLFIEKPLSNSIEGVDELLQICEQKKLVLMMGFYLRFHPTLLVARQLLDQNKLGKILFFRSEVGQSLSDWRPTQDSRLSVSGQRILGGGVVLELSHELDYARWLLGEVRTLQAQTCRLTELGSDVEDAADILLEFESGATGSIHLDMIQRPSVRNFKIVGSEGTLCGNLKTGELSLFVNGQESPMPLKPWALNDLYISELTYFFDCIRSRKPPLVSGIDGKRALEMALFIKKAAIEGGRITL